MSKEIIPLRDAMQMLRLGKRCNISFISFDKKRNKGGQLKHAENIILVQAKKSDGLAVDNDYESNILPGIKKDPNHRVHGTFNIQYTNGDVEKVHTVLLTQFNKKRIAI